MKDVFKMFGIILSAMLFVFLIIYFWINMVDKKAETNNFNKQIGVYFLDIYKTDLGFYSRDTGIYKNLQIEFKSDGTFYMNMKVPFLFDSIGKWNASGNGLEDWNWLYYKSWDYSLYKKNTGNQFTSPWTLDSSFYINGATPQKGQKGIQMIYFTKIKDLKK